MAFVYVLYSQKLDKYYVGSCLNLSERIDEHQSGKYKGSYTAKTSDWILFFSIRDLEYDQARLIETHIKKMKSRKYITDLKKYEDMSVRLIKLYS
jgi:putative endonuclease